MRGAIGPGPLSAEDHERLTVRARLYGFHATLKAPFHLSENEPPQALSIALSAIARRFPTFSLPALRVAPLADFLALVPTGPSPKAAALAAACVVELDHFRAPPTKSEVARRNPDRFTARQRQFLDSWGYPYVLEEFRWHITLTDRLESQTVERVAPYLARAYDALCGNEPAVVDGLSLMHQPMPDTPFTVVERVPLPEA